jgi:hypothetical protein
MESRHGVWRVKTSTRAAACSRVRLPEGRALCFEVRRSVSILCRRVLRKEFTDVFRLMAIDEACLSRLLA